MLASLNSRYRSLPSRVRSPTPQNTDLPPCPFATLLISSWMTTVLPTPAPPKSPILPPFTNGAIRSTTLMPVSKISVFGSRSTKSGRFAVNRPPLDARRDRRAVVDGLAEHVEDAAERRLADRHRDRRAGVDDVHAAHDAVGRRHRDGAHLVAADVLLHLGHDADLLAARRCRVDLERVVELGQVLGLELDVEDRSDDLDDLADLCCLVQRSVAMIDDSVRVCCGRVYLRAPRRRRRSRRFPA